MTLAVVCNESFKNEFLSKSLPKGINAIFIHQVEDIPIESGVIIDLLFANTPQRIAALASFLPKPVLINAVTETLAELRQPFIRINAWPGFLSKGKWEVAALPEQAGQVWDLFAKLGWDYVLVPDVAGMISARIVAVIINEAWYTFGAGVSTREEIDIAMKLGTHYPHGPFEWGLIIGWKNIFDLLTKLSVDDNRYKVSESLSEYLKKSLKPD